MNSANINRKEDGMYNGKPNINFLKELQLVNTNSVSHHENNYDHDKNNFPSKRKIIYQNREYDVAKGSSYICQPINKGKDTIRINDVIVKEDLILCCKPRQGKYTYMKQNSIGGDIDNVTPNTEEERTKKSNYLIENKFYQEEKYNYNEKSKHMGEPQLPELVPSGLGTSLILQDHFPKDYVHKPDVNSELERKMKCTKLTKRFKNCLWALFFINLFIIMVGTILLIHTLLHFLRRHYISTVIEETGFFVWILVLMVISVFVITVGVYGIITAIDRCKRILIVYCIVASALILIILVFLVYQWILYKHIEDIGDRSMGSTFRVYRCDRNIREAWDNLQLMHQCCGIDDPSDWKYVPTSCCNAQTKQQKIACLKHYISEEQAFNDGCRIKLKNYFDTFFVVAACLLILALLLMVLGVLVSSWLMERYKNVKKCQEVYYISR